MEKKEFIIDLLGKDDVVFEINKELEQLLVVVPELKNMIGFEHRHPHHHLDVWKHTLLALSFSENQLKTRMALLLHDIGKPFCYQEDGVVRHYRGHAAKSVMIAESILVRLEFEPNFINDVTEIVRRHDIPLSESDVATYPALSKEIFEVQKCDALAHNPEFNQDRLAYIKKIESIIRS